MVDKGGEQPPRPNCDELKREFVVNVLFISAVAIVVAVLRDFDIVELILAVPFVLIVAAVSSLTVSLVRRTFRR